jgi:hypothetical protein
MTAPHFAGAVASKLTVRPHWPGSLAARTFAGQVIGQESTVTVNTHSESGLLLLPSLAVQVTVVAPTGKHDPEGGTQLTTALPQLSVALGVG